MLSYGFIHKADHISHWISFLFLALVTLIPFSTALLSKYPYSSLVITIYSSNLIFIGLTLYWHWLNALKSKLVDDNIPANIIKYAKIRCLGAPAGYLIAVMMAFVDTRISLVMCGLVPLFYIIPGMQKVWMHLAS